MDKYDHHKQFTILRIRPVLNDKMPRQGFVVGCYLVDGAVLFPSHATNRQDKQTQETYVVAKQSHDETYQEYDKELNA